MKTPSLASSVPLAPVNSSIAAVSKAAVGLSGADQAGPEARAAPAATIATPADSARLRAATLGFD